MKIEFAVTLPVADVLVIPVQKNGTDAAIGGRAGQDILAAAAAAARFEGEAGAIAEAFVGADGAVNRVLLVGIGEGSETDWERAGGAGQKCPSREPRLSAYRRMCIELVAAGGPQLITRTLTRGTNVPRSPI